MSGGGELQHQIGRLRRPVAARLLAIAAVLDGHSRHEAATLGGMDRQTLRDWVHRFNAEGMAGLRDRSRSGRPRLLADALRPELAALIADGPELERDGVVEYRLAHIQELAQRHFGADYSRSGLHAVLQQMGLSWQAPRPIHPKTDPAAQEAFKKTSPATSPPSPSAIPASGWRCLSRTKPASARKAP